MTSERATRSEPRDVPVMVLSGPSGSGKSTIVNRLIEESPVKLVKVISATTRPPRSMEVDGEDYYFLSDAEFSRRRENEEFLECAEVHGSGHWYGTLKSELQRAARTGGWALLEIDVQGMLRVLEQYPEALTIFLTTRSETEYERRLRGRGTEAEHVIQKRLQTARNELKHADRYQHRVVNDDLNSAVRQILEIVLSWEKKTHA